MTRAEVIARAVENHITETYNKPYRTCLTYTDNGYDLAVIYDEADRDAQREEVERTYCETLNPVIVVERKDINAIEVHYAL